MAQSTVNPARTDPYKDFRFRVKWDGRYVAGVSHVVVPPRRREAFSHGERGDPRPSRRTPGRTKYEAISLQRGVTHDSEFARWLTGAGASPGTPLEDLRRDLIIDVFDEAGQKLLSYKVYRCWVSEFRGLPELDADVNAVGIESIKLDCESWMRDDVVEP